MERRIVLITGTSSGVGFSAAVLFAQHGYKVFASMRDTTKASKLLEKAAEHKVEVELLQLDVANNDSIEQAVNAIISKEGRIDVLVNNAGAGLVKNVEQASLEEIQWVTDVNYFGSSSSFLVLLLLLLQSTLTLLLSLITAL